MPRAAPHLLCGTLAAVIVLLGATAPLVDDTLFWWVPKALIAVEQGPAWVLAGDLPEAVGARSPLPPQWSGGLPDYGHPPLWYWWLAAFLHLPVPVHVAAHLAVLPLAVVHGLGLAALMRRLGGPRAAWAAPALLLMPPVVSQLWRADTDVPLLALSTWALVALADRRDGLFALLAGLATACKEPGILLAAPAAFTMLLDRRWRWGWLAPPAVLAAWAWVHHGEAGWALAGTERLPESPGIWLRDVATVLWIALGDQGRWLLWPLAAGLAWRQGTGLRRRTTWIVAVHTATWLVFFGTLNFLGGMDRLDRHTHVRYLLPGMTAGAALPLAVAPLAGVPLTAVSLWRLHEVSPHGPESSLLAVDTARAVQLAAVRLRELEGPVWVGSYAFTQLTRPYAGVVTEPVPDLRLYAFGTEPDEVSGHLLHCSVGEPLGRLQELQLDPVERFEVHRARATLYRVRGR